MTPYLMYKLLKILLSFLSVLIFPLYTLLGITIYSIYKFKKNNQILLIVLFISTYSFPFFLYGFFDIYLAFYVEFLNPDIFNSVLKIHTLFNCVLFIFLNKNTKIPAFTHTSYILYYVSIIALLFFIFGPTQGSILSSESYGEIKNSRILGIPAEYGIGFVFFLITFNFKNKFWTHFLIILFCLKYLSLGMRVVIIEVFLLYVVSNNLGKLSIKKILSYSLVVLTSMNLFAIYRSGSKELINWVFVFLDVNIANATNVLYSSLRIFAISELGFLDLVDKITSFFLLVFGSFNPGFGFELSNLSNFMRDEYPAGGGGLISVFSYVMLGYFGVCLMAYFIAKVLNNSTFSKSSNLLVIYCSIVYFIIPRWYSYYPTQLFKFSIYFIIVYLIFNYKKKLRFEL